jgi:hypothetical protein
MRKCERICCGVITLFPLAFIYSLSTWSVWVSVNIGMRPAGPLSKSAYKESVVGGRHTNYRSGHFLIFLSIVFYVLLNWSYTTAVFTDPGSPSRSQPVDQLPTTSIVTVKSTGDMRFCKKCMANKPDRAHHCSTCRRCVLKMDHHCPWLATCVGLRNYKPFLLFLIYTSLLGLTCFAISGGWLLEQINQGDQLSDESVMQVHFIVMSVVSGILGLVLSGFTIWHIYLSSRNRTTIESLEKTRYLSPLRAQVSRMQQPQTYVDEDNHTLGEQLRDMGNTLAGIHANALPGVLRPEEGEERMSPAQNSLRRNINPDSYGRQERDQYNDYLDERDNEKLPNAFDLGVKRNLITVFGPNPWFWLIPVCNSIGDGWNWEHSSEWTRQKEMLRREREIEMQRQDEMEQAAGWGGQGHFAASEADRVLGRRPDQYLDARQGPPPRSTNSPSRTADSSDDYDSSDDEQTDGRTKLLRKSGPHPGAQVTENWNDVPDDMVMGGSSTPSRTNRRR